MSAAESPAGWLNDPSPIEMIRYAEQRRVEETEFQRKWREIVQRVSRASAEVDRFLGKRILRQALWEDCKTVGDLSFSDEFWLLTPNIGKASLARIRAAQERFPSDTVLCADRPNPS